VPGSKIQFKATRPFAVAIAVIAIIVSMGLLLLSVFMSPGAPTTFLSTLSGLVFTLAVGGVVYELLLREAVFAESAELLNLKQGVVKSGLMQIDAESAFDWREKLVDSAKFRLQIATPYGWLEQIWPHVLESGSNHRVDVEIYLPNSTSPVLESLAARHGQDPKALAEQIVSFVDYLKTSWQNAEDGHRPLKQGSHLAIKIFDTFPTCEIAMTDSRVFVRTGGALSVAPGESVLCLELNHGAGTFPVPWLLAQLTAMEVLPSVWDGKVKL
jgi:hypothetical protein